MFEFTWVAQVLITVLTLARIEALYIRGNSTNSSEPINPCQYTLCTTDSKCVAKTYPCLAPPCPSFAVCVRVRPGFCPLASPRSQPWLPTGASPQNPWFQTNSLQQNPWLWAGANQQNPWLQRNAFQQNPWLQRNAFQQNPWLQRNAFQQNPWLQRNAFQQNPWSQTGVNLQNPWSQTGVNQKNPWFGTGASPFCVDQCSIDENCPVEQKCCHSGYCNSCVYSVPTPWSIAITGNAAAAAEEAEEAAEV